MRCQTKYCRCGTPRQETLLRWRNSSKNDVISRQVVSSIVAVFGEIGKVILGTGKKDTASDERINEIVVSLPCVLNFGWVSNAEVIALGVLPISELAYIPQQRQQRRCSRSDRRKCTASTIAKLYALVVSMNVTLAKSRE
jgi:hypothetical protein